MSLTSSITELCFSNGNVFSVAGITTATTTQGLPGSSFGPAMCPSTDIDM
jgi:hypothetical protein